MVVWYHGTMEYFQWYYHDVLYELANFAVQGVKIREKLKNSIVPHGSVVPWQSGTMVLQKSSDSTIMIYYISRKANFAFQGVKIRENLKNSMVPHDSTVPWQHSTMLPWQRGTMVLQNSSDGTIMIYYISRQANFAWASRSEKISKTQWYQMIAWQHGSVVPWYHGTVEQFRQYHGTIEQFRQYHHDLLNQQVGQPCFLRC